MLWFLSAELKHVQASGRSKDALSDQTQSVNSFTGPTAFPNRPGASALSLLPTLHHTGTRKQNTYLVHSVLALVKEIINEKSTLE